MQKRQELPYDVTMNITPEPFNRPPRIWAPPPEVTVEIPAPPAKEAVPPMPEMVMMIMPFIMIGCVFSIYIFVQHASPQQLTFLLPMAIFMIMSPLGSFVGARQKRKMVRRKNRLRDKKYRAELATIQEYLEQITNEQRYAALLTDPDPASLEQQINDRTHLWERRPQDVDFLSVRIGIGLRPCSSTIKTPQMDPLDPLTKDIREIEEAFRQVPNIPCVISLQKAKSLGITGARQKVAAVSRGILCQIATQHSPEDVRILAIYPASQRQGWDWLRELPHTLPLKGCKLDRLTAVGEDEANHLLNFLLEELSQRASKDEETPLPSTGAPDQLSPLPHLVVIVHDYVRVSKHPALTHAFKLGEQLGVSIIYLAAQEQAIPSECRGVVRLADDESLTYAAVGFDRETLKDVSADMLDLEHAFRITHLLEGIQLIDEDESADIPTNVRFLDLIDLPYADQFTPEKWWEQPPFGLLRIPIGMSAKGPIWFDLNDHAHGPHGIVAGTTGAGKSELLQSLIVGLAITHHPYLVNFVLVDFKGGAAFKPFEKIPHTVGMVTDLSGNLTERALVALKGELKRREHLLSNANAKNISEYLYMRTKSPSSLDPVPHLFIIIDEFAELAKEHPTFMEGLVSVVQKGRSLGVHLILATQKPTGAVNPNIWSNLKFRICLRVASLQDSRDMLGRSEAALLPSTIPGRGYFQIGSEIFELFQSARISLPARVANKAVFTAKQEGATGEVTDMKVLMDALEPYQATLGEQLFKPWTPPLPHRISLPEIYRQTPLTDPMLLEKTKRPPYGWLTCPMGLIDLPAEQKQETWMLDMPRAGGHVLVTGASGAGKSVFLRTLITSLARTHLPTQLHFYIVDFGGQSLRAFEKLPHVGGVFGEADDIYIRPLLRKLNGTIDVRKHFFAANQIDDFPAYQRRRFDRADLPELPAVILVIDRFLDFKQVYEREMDQLLTIFRSGRTYGVYMAISVDRPGALSMQIMGLIELRVALRQLEVTDSIFAIGKHLAAYIDPATPGRAYLRSKSPEEIQIALPVIGDTDDEQTQNLDETLALLALKEGAATEGGAQVGHAPPIQLLPDYVDIGEILADAAPETNEGAEPVEVIGVQQSLSLQIAVEDFSLHAVTLDLNADTPHALVVGGPGSGRTGVLHTCLLMLAKPQYMHAKVVMVDFRRSSRPLRRLPRMWMYADTEETLLASIETLKTELRQRVAQIREELEQMAEDSDEVPGTTLAPIVLIIDDYEQLAGLTKNPLNDLKEFLLQARDLHLHIIVVVTANDAVRGDPVLQQVKICRMGVVLGGDPADQAVMGVRMSDQPPGRGYLVRRSRRSLIQVAHLAPASVRYWVNHFRSR